MIEFYDKSWLVLVDTAGQVPAAVNFQSGTIDTLIDNGGTFIYRAVAFVNGVAQDTVSRTLTIDVPTALDVTLGYDYWLPDWVEQYEYSRLVATGSDLIDPIGSFEGQWAQVWRPHWKDFHAADGVFDWTAFDAKLAAIEGGGSDLQLNLLSSERAYIPQWALDKHGIIAADSVVIDGRRYYPAWDEGLRDEFEAFVAALGARYNGHPQISSWYIHGISSSQGEELFFGSQTAANNAWAAGLTPEVMAQWLGDRLDAFAAAFVGDEHKLMWTGEVEGNRYITRTDGDPEKMKWSDAASILAHKAWALGMGHRGGNTERVWNKAGWFAMQDTSWAQHANVGTSGEWDHRHGYLAVNEDIWPVADQKIALGEENEEYGSAWVSRFGSLEHHPVRYELSMMRVLQLRVNHLWVYIDGVEMGPALTEYVRLSMGRLWHDSPDAFSRLCSAPSSKYYIGGHTVPGIGGELGLHYMRNIERFLYQRNVPASAGVSGGLAVPAGRVNRSYDCLNLTDGFGSDYWYDNLGLSTDIATDNPCIYFKVDQRWVPSSTVRLFVTSKNAGTGRWRVEYMTQAGPDSTVWVRHSGDSQVLSTHFDLENVEFSGAYGGDLDMDFVIAAEEDDVEIRLVRLVRWLQREAE